MTHNSILGGNGDDQSRDREQAPRERKNCNDTEQEQIIATTLTLGGKDHVSTTIDTMAKETLRHEERNGGRRMVMTENRSKTNTIPLSQLRTPEAVDSAFVDNIMNSQEDFDLSYHENKIQSSYSFSPIHFDCQFDMYVLPTFCFWYYVEFFVCFFLLICICHN